MLLIMFPFQLNPRYVSPHSYTANCFQEKTETGHYLGTWCILLHFKQNVHKWKTQLCLGKKMFPKFRCIPHFNDFPSSPVPIIDLHMYHVYVVLCRLFWSVWFWIFFAICFKGIPSAYYRYCGSQQQHSLTLRTYLYLVKLKNFQCSQSFLPRFNMDFYGDRP